MDKQSVEHVGALLRQRSILHDQMHVNLEKMSKLDVDIHEIIEKESKDTGTLDNPEGNQD